MSKDKHTYDTEDEEILNEELQEDLDNEDSESSQAEEAEAGSFSLQDKSSSEETSQKKRSLMDRILNDDSESGSLKDMFIDMQISREWLKKHWSLLLIIFICLMLFVTNRYQAQQEIIEESNLKKELNDWKFKWLAKFSDLTRSTRQSQIEAQLKAKGDTTLVLSKNAPFIIKAK